MLTLLVLNASIRLYHKSLCMLCVIATQKYIITTVVVTGGPDFIQSLTNNRLFCRASELFNALLHKSS